MYYYPILMRIRSCGATKIDNKTCNLQSILEKMQLSLLVFLGLLVAVYATYDCSSSCSASNCLHFTGSNIGTNTVKSAVVYNRTVSVTLNNWVKKTGSNKYKCFDYAVAQGFFLCLQVETTSGSAYLEPGFSGQYCAPITQQQQGNKIVYTQQTVDSVTARVSSCPTLAPVLAAGPSAICSENTALLYEVNLGYPVGLTATYQWTLDSAAVGIGSTYLTPSNLGVSTHAVQVTVTNQCAESAVLSRNLNVQQSPSASLTSNVADEATVAIGSTLTLSWTTGSANQGVLEHYVNNVLVSTNSGLTGSYNNAVAAGSHYLLLVVENTNCETVRELRFTAVDPNANPVVTVTFSPTLQGGNTMLSSVGVYDLTWSATNVGLNDPLLVTVTGSSIPSVLYPGQGITYDLFWWSPSIVSFENNYAITNAFNKSGGFSQTILVVNDN